MNIKPNLEGLLKEGFKPTMIVTPNKSIWIYETDYEGVLYDSQRDIIIKRYQKERWQQIKP